MEISVKEGFIPFRGYRTWYRVVGAGETKVKVPLLCLHGGPGMSHDYLETLEAIALTGRQVIFYDQLGCGNSDHPHNPALWGIDLFVDEIHHVRQALGLHYMHLLGQSWGGFLAQEYMLTRPAGIRSLILANSAASTWRWIAEANRLRAELPESIQQILTVHEEDGSTADPTYASATNVYYNRHLCRLNPMPECLQRSIEKLGQDPEVYNTMWGPSEFFCNGILQNWDIESRLSEIDLPTLILSGVYDESTIAINQHLQQSIRGSEWVLFEHSAHTPHLEETNKYLQVLDNFLSRMDDL